MKKVRIAIIGCGRIAQRHAARATDAAKGRPQARGAAALAGRGDRAQSLCPDCKSA